jgi:hypothetical protein
MAITNSPKARSGSTLVLKLFISVSLLCLAWHYSPAHAQGACPPDAQLDAHCFTVNDCGDQTCESDASPGTRYKGTCTLSALDDPCVHHGCLGSTCDIYEN